MFLLSRNPRPHLLLITNNFSFFSYIHHQWWPCLNLHPLISPLRENTQRNFSKQKTHPMHISNNIFINQWYKISFRNKEPTQNTTHWALKSSLMSVFFVFCNSLLSSSYLFKYFHVFTISHVIKHFFMGGNISNNSSLLDHKKHL